MELDFQKGQGLLPVVIQDSHTHQVLMLGFMNQEAYQMTVSTQKVTFFSRTKNRLWTKGETSGNFLLVDTVMVDCDGDTLLIKAKPQGPTCHLGTTSCFQDDKMPALGFLGKLQKIIKNRKNNADTGSYTASLFDAGVSKMAQKVGEEAVEVIIEAAAGNNQRLREESADLLFHLMVLLEARDLSLTEIVEVLQERHRLR